jgi:hypothetical protein
MSNEAVAEFLLENGLSGFAGVVYLDSMDRPMVRLRGSTSERQRRPAVHLHECGLRPEQRFTFYDNVHTTGLDVPQAPNALAVITIGKDTTLRDYSQGAYRMRGVGQVCGHTLCCLSIRIFQIANFKSRHFVLSRVNV